MTPQPETRLVLELNQIGELFNAPDVNPFSSHEVEILGEAGMARLRKRVMARWPSRPGPVRLTLRMPLEQISPDLARETALAIQRHSENKMEDNRRRRRNTVRVSLRLVLMTVPLVLLTVGLLFLLTIPPLAAPPGAVSGIVAVLAVYACSVAIFDSVYGLVFDWVPFVRDNSSYQRLGSVELTIEPLGSGELSA